MLSKLRLVACGLSLAVVLSVSGWADGVIIPDRPEHGWLTIVYHDVTVTVRDGVVTTRIDQTFRNQTGRPLEGEYIFPLPPDAVVSEFTMWIDGRPQEAKILDADEARAIYEDFVRRAIDPALLEYVGRAALSARVFPIPAGGERRIEIAYTELLAAEGGVYRYRYPLDTERFSARPIERVSVAFDLRTSAPLRAVYSPTHDLRVERIDERTATATYVARNALPDRDVLLYYSVSPEALGMTLLTYRAPGEDGYFLLIATPPDPAGAERAIPKDLVFVLDRSGSMQGTKIAQAKEALKYVLDNLHPEDRFAVVAFSDVVETLDAQLHPVTAETLARATAWAGRIDADGGTNIRDALSVAFSLFEPTDRPRFLIFLTDGEPTVGETDPVAIARAAQAANRADARVFVFGVGYDVNTILLDQLAREHRGTTTYVLPSESLEARLSSFYRKIASPLLADLSLTIAGVETFDIHPQTLPDLFRGTQLLVLGRFSGSGEVPVTIAGQAAGVPTAYTTLQTFPDAAMTDAFLPRIWAGRKIAHLLDQIRLYGEQPELIDEVIRWSKRFGIITPYTSFLIDDRGLGAEEMADAVRQQAAAPPSGASAVQASTALRTLAESETVQGGIGGVRTVDDRTYFLVNGVWTDSEFEDEATIEIAAYSDAYFELLDLCPWIGPHLAIADRVIVRVGDEYVEIGSDGIRSLSAELRDRLAR